MAVDWSSVRADFPILRREIDANRHAELLSNLKNELR